MEAEGVWDGEDIVVWLVVVGGVLGSLGSGSNLILRL